MPTTQHPWIAGFPPGCANEREGKSVRVRDFLGRAWPESLKEKTEIRQSAAEDRAKGNATP
jgi:hypothetical protein